MKRDAPESEPCMVLPRLKDTHVTSVRNVSFGLGWGTAFLWGDEQGSFFVTARHVVEAAAAGDNLTFRTNSGKEQYEFGEIVHSSTHDISVFTLKNAQIALLQYPSKIGVRLGQRTLFLGFPHGLEGNYPSSGYPPPLVRNAFFSGVTTIGGAELLILDGFNNPGYSGGPVYVATEDGEDVALLGAISGYRFESEAHSRVYKRDPSGQEAPLPDIYVKPNSGMIYATGRRHIQDLASQLSTRQP